MLSTLFLPNNIELVLRKVEEKLMSAQLHLQTNGKTYTTLSEAYDLCIQAITDVESLPINQHTARTFDLQKRAHFFTLRLALQLSAIDNDHERITRHLNFIHRSITNEKATSCDELSVIRATTLFIMSYQSPKAQAAQQLIMEGRHLLFKHAMPKNPAILAKKPSAFKINLAVCLQQCAIALHKQNQLSEVELVTRRLIRLLETLVAECWRDLEELLPSFEFAVSTDLPRLITDLRISAVYYAEEENKEERRDEPDDSHLRRKKTRTSKYPGLIKSAQACRSNALRLLEHTENPNWKNVYFLNLQAVCALRVLRDDEDEHTQSLLRDSYWLAVKAGMRVLSMRMVSHDQALFMMHQIKDFADSLIPLLNPDALHDQIKRAICKVICLDATRPQFALKINALLNCLKWSPAELRTMTPTVSDEVYQDYAWCYALIAHKLAEAKDLEHSQRYFHLVIEILITANIFITNLLEANLYFPTNFPPLSDLWFAIHDYLTRSAIRVNNFSFVPMESDYEARTLIAYAREVDETSLWNAIKRYHCAVTFYHTHPHLLEDDSVKYIEAFSRLIQYLSLIPDDPRAYQLAGHLTEALFKLISVGYQNESLTPTKQLDFALFVVLGLVSWQFGNALARLCDRKYVAFAQQFMQITLIKCNTQMRPKQKRMLANFYYRIAVLHQSFDQHTDSKRYCFKLVQLFHQTAKQDKDIFILQLAYAQLHALASVGKNDLCRSLYQFAHSFITHLNAPRVYLNDLQMLHAQMIESFKRGHLQNHAEYYAFLNLLCENPKLSQALWWLHDALPEITNITNMTLLKKLLNEAGSYVKQLPVSPETSPTLQRLRMAGAVKTANEKQKEAAPSVEKRHKKA